MACLNLSAYRIYRTPASLCLSLHITTAMSTTTTPQRRRKKLHLSYPQTATWNSHISSVIMSPPPVVRAWPLPAATPSLDQAPTSRVVILEENTREIILLRTRAIEQTYLSIDHGYNPSCERIFTSFSSFPFFVKKFRSLFSKDRFLSFSRCCLYKTVPFFSLRNSLFFLTPFQVVSHCLRCSYAFHSSLRPTDYTRKDRSGTAR